jgi:hypothetical protein
MLHTGNTKGILLCPLNIISIMCACCIVTYCIPVIGNPTTYSVIDNE